MKVGYSEAAAPARSGGRPSGSGCLPPGPLPSPARPCTGPFPRVVYVRTLTLSRPGAPMVATPRSPRRRHARRGEQRVLSRRECPDHAPRPRHLSGVARRSARNQHPQPLTSDGREVSTRPPGRRTRRDSAPTRETRDFREEGGRSRNRFLGRGCLGRQEHATHEPLIKSVTFADVPLAGLSFSLPIGWRSAPRRTGESGPRSGFDTGYPARPPSAGCRRGHDRTAGY